MCSSVCWSGIHLVVDTRYTRVALPWTAEIQVDGERASIITKVFGVQIQGHCLDSPIIILVLPFSTRGDWGFQLRLRDVYGRERNLTLPTLVSASEAGARHAGIEIASLIAGPLGVKVQYVSTA